MPLLNASLIAAAALASPSDVPPPPPTSVYAQDSVAPSVPSPKWAYEGFYFLSGVAPGTTLDLDGINPMIRYDAELGMHWKKKKWSVGFGAETWLTQYYERKRLGIALHGVVTVTRRPIYVRAGAGSLTGIPGTPDDNVFRPAVGVLFGAGLEGGGDSVLGRFGLDYHISLDKEGRVNNTVMLTIRFKFG